MMRALAPAFTLAAVLVVGGCETKSFFDPSEVGRYKHDPLTVKILDQLDPAVEQPNQEFVNAQPPTQADLNVDNTDYKIVPGDTLTITVADLSGTGAETLMTRRVSESGNVSMQLIKEPVRAEGLTELQLQDAIIQSYRDANILPDAQVSVVVQDRQGSTFNVLGAIGQPGRYPIPQADFRLLDAIVMARDITASIGVESIYIIRKTSTAAPYTPSPTPANAPAEGATTRPPQSQDPLAPRSEANPESPVKPVAMMQADNTARGNRGTEGRYTVIDGKPMMVNSDGSRRPATETERRNATSSGGGSQGQFAFNAPQEPTDRRSIRIPWEDLKNGNLKYNVIVKADDTIFIPQPTVGEYYMGGHVGAAGAYSLSGRKITLTQAVISARMLDPVAIPKRTEVRRRIGDNNLLIARIDLQKIFQGAQPDLYLKPDDEVMVGTNAIAPFLLALRNGFRIAYGFGFLYDRNFYRDNRNTLN